MQRSIDFQVFKSDMQKTQSVRHSKMQWVLLAQPKCASSAAIINDRQIAAYVASWVIQVLSKHSWRLGIILSGESSGREHAQVVHELISRCGVDVQDNVKTSFTLPATNSTSSVLKSPLRLPALMGYHLSWQKKSDKCGLKLSLWRGRHCMTASGRNINNGKQIRESSQEIWYHLSQY